MSPGKSHTPIDSMAVLFCKILTEKYDIGRREPWER